MTLVKDGQTIEITAPGTIDAYISEGWAEAVPEEEKPKPEKKPAKAKQ